MGAASHSLLKRPPCVDLNFQRRHQDPGFLSSIGKVIPASVPESDDSSPDNRSDADTGELNHLQLRVKLEVWLYISRATALGAAIFGES